MNNTDYLLVEANLMPWNGKHYIDRETKRRMMEYKGVTVVWDADAELWRMEG